MAERKAISKKLRFEVFKRDSFTCQYCGRSAPDVILEIDHIQPIAEGGSNNILNLITSCRDCNRGKGKTKLTESQTLKKEKAQLEELQERREQMKMMMQWRTELLELIDEQTECINDYLGSVTDFYLSDSGKRIVKRLLREFGFTGVMDATEIAFDKYYKGTEYSFSTALNKVGGVCYNRRNGIKNVKQSN